MKMLNFVSAIGVFLALGGPAALADEPMGFFVTSVGMGDGGNLGGLEGADAHCQKLAEAAGSKGRTWGPIFPPRKRENAASLRGAELVQDPGTMPGASSSLSISISSTSCPTSICARRWTKAAIASWAAMTSAMSMTF